MSLCPGRPQAGDGSHTGPRFWHSGLLAPAPPSSCPPISQGQLMTTERGPGRETGVEGAGAVLCFNSTAAE